MDRKSKILLAVLVFALLVSVGVTYYKTFIQKDYKIDESIPVKG